MKKQLAITFLSAACLLTGCVVAPVATRDPYYGEPVVVAPPPPHVEYAGPPPVAGYVWIGGFWNWGSGRYAWTPGRWEAPRPGYGWVPHRWEQDGGYWRQASGYWGADRRGGGGRNRR